MTEVSTLEITGFFLTKMCCSLCFRSILMAGTVFMIIGLMQIALTFILQAGVGKLDTLFSLLLVRCPIRQ